MKDVTEVRMENEKSVEIRHEGKYRFSFSVDFVEIDNVGIDIYYHNVLFTKLYFEDFEPLMRDTFIKASGPEDKDNIKLNLQD